MGSMRRAAQATRLDIADWRAATRQIERPRDRYHAIDDAKVSPPSRGHVERPSLWIHWVASHATRHALRA